MILEIYSCWKSLDVYNLLGGFCLNLGFPTQCSLTSWAWPWKERWECNAWVMLQLLFHLSILAQGTICRSLWTFQLLFSEAFCLVANCHPLNHNEKRTFFFLARTKCILLISDTSPMKRLYPALTWRWIRMISSIFDFCNPIILKLFWSLKKQALLPSPSCPVY